MKEIDMIYVGTAQYCWICYKEISGTIYQHSGLGKPNYEISFVEAKNLGYTVSNISDIKYKKNLKLYRVSQKKSVICGAWWKIILFCATLLNGVFSIFSENLLFFLVLQWPKKNPRTFFLLKSKVQKDKNV